MQVINRIAKDTIQFCQTVWDPPVNKFKGDNSATKQPIFKI